MYILNILQKKKNLFLFANKLLEKVPGTSNAKECGKSYLSRKNTKFIKRSGMITQQLRTIET